MSATLTITPAPEVGDHVRRVVVDCWHGTTTLHQFDTEQVHVPDAALVSLALLEHTRSERCACTATLWRRYAPTMGDE